MRLRFVQHETTLDYMHALHDHILAHGVLTIFCSDLHSIFRINAKDADPQTETRFSRAAREIEIEGVQANSPQAKGCLERANQTLQDRLIKEMRLDGVNDMESANIWLLGFIAKHTHALRWWPVTHRMRI